MNTMHARVLLVAVALGGCATTAPGRRTSAGTCDVARDRAAILAMAGDFQVDFAFTEGEVLTPGYGAKAPYHATAHEVVTVLSQSDTQIVLQHVLLADRPDGTAVPQKHWRHDWTFEKSELLEFRGQRVWARRTLGPAESRCAWSQAVFEVDDGPRYESSGRFVYTGDTATWISGETWRPLPRREYTKRSDYDVLVGVNRHVITAKGWVHEQDNVKLALAGDRKLVREQGVNRYTRVASKSAGVAKQYLETTAAFWSAVRAEWQATLAARARLTVQAVVDGERLYEQLFPLSEEPPPPAQLQAKVHELVARYVAEAPPVAALQPK